MKLTNLHDTFALKLGILLDVETQLKKFLPRVARSVTNKDLEKLLKQHAGEVKDEITRLKDICDRVGIKAAKVKSDGIRGIIEDAEWLMKIRATDEARDAALIGAIQYIEHYEIAAYGTAAEWADDLGFHDVARELHRSNKEEIRADKKLSKLARRMVNQQARMAM